VKETIDCKEQEEAPDVDNWVWLKSVIENLGEDGMSSEDSDADDDDDDLEITYRPTIMQWRRNMDLEMKIIDDEYQRIARTQSRRGAKPSRRIRNGRNTVSVRDPVCELPACFYNQDWLVQQTDKYIIRTLKPAKMKSVWRELMVE
jgi:hypothetical protein